MQELIQQYITQYGYLAFFGIILLQELGVPGLPNELVLFYLGYLGNRYGLSFPAAFTLVIAADTLGSCLLYSIFYYSGDHLLQRKWMQYVLPAQRLQKIRSRIVAGNGLPIFVGKLTPFIRNGIPVAAGLLRIEPFRYSAIIICSAIVWSGGWISAGWICQSWFQ
jgi:membrane protein DedA with SNARE-associated domain